MSKITEIIKNNIEVNTEILKNGDLTAQIAEISDQITSAFKQGNIVFFAGNGGSYGDAIHLAGEFTARFKIERKTLPAIALGSNNATLTAIGNDYCFEDIFSRELEGIAKKGDILIVISTSGNSENILRTIKTANANEIKTYGLTGIKGVKMNELCTCINVPSDNTARIQESHILIGHIICELVEEKLFNNF
ncbi:MAG: phosphoheptose isomerase [Marinilabiliales bacterium]|nr:MAG: phosphoheptose isomerase [Marinilabiliales bacterium]